MNARTYPQNQTISPPDGHWLKCLTSWLQSRENFQPQRHASTRNKLRENSTKPLKRFSGLWCNKKSCDFGGSRFSSESAEQNDRFIRDPNETNHLINLLLPVSPAPSRTEWWVKWLPTLRLHLEKASLSPFVCYFCVFVCREHAYPPKKMILCSYLISWEMKEGLRLSGFVEKPNIYQWNTLYAEQQGFKVVIDSCGPNATDQRHIEDTKACCCTVY